MLTCDLYVHVNIITCILHVDINLSYVNIITLTFVLHVGDRSMPSYRDSIPKDELKIVILIETFVDMSIITYEPFINNVRNISMIL